MIAKILARSSLTKLCDIFAARNLVLAGSATLQDHRGGRKASP